MRRTKKTKQIRAVLAALAAVTVLVGTSGCSLIFGAAFGRHSTASDPTASAVSGTRQSAGNSNQEGVLGIEKIAEDIFYGSDPTETVPSTTPTSKYKALRVSHNFECLPSKASKDLYQEIDASIHQIDAKRAASGGYPIKLVNAIGKLPEAEIRAAIAAYRNDNPQIFWLANAYSYRTRNGNTMLQLYSNLSPQECRTAIGKLNAAVSSAMASMPTGLSEFDREERLFDFVTGHCFYDDAVMAGKTRWEDFCSYGALVDGRTVCEGYARGTQLLAQYAGLDCSLVSGESGGVGHMWNAIRIGGAWYHIDVTWCDNPEDSNESRVTYNYFNVPDSIVEKTHTIDPRFSSIDESSIDDEHQQFNLFLPTCNATEQNYFRVRGIPVAEPAKTNDAAVVKAIAAELKKGKEMIPFYVSGNFDAIVPGITISSPYRLSEWLKKAQKLSGRSVAADQTSFLEDGDDRGLMVFIKYHK